MTTVGALCLLLLRTCQATLAKSDLRKTQCVTGEEDCVHSVPHSAALGSRSAAPGPQSPPVTPSRPCVVTHWSLVVPQHGT